MATKPRMQEICEMVTEAADLLLKKKVEGISSVAKVEGGWRVDVETLERKAIPDTQDLIAKYQFDLDEGGDVTGYHRVEIRRRGDLEVIEEEV